MGLFPRRADKPHAEPFMGDGQLPELVDETASGGFARTHDVLSAAEPRDRMLMIQLLAEHQPADDRWLRSWSHAHPQSSLPRTACGAVAIIDAWQARGDGEAETVSDQGWHTFFDQLRTAEAHLQAAAQVEPQDPTPSAFLVLSGRGLQVGLDELRRRWSAVEARAPRHRAAANHMIQALSPKWGGSDEDMFGFARAHSAAAPEGDPIHTLIAEAHLERWLDLAGHGDDYLRSVPVRNELREVAERSVASPQWRSHRFELFDRSIMALALGLAGDEAACAQFDWLDGRMSDHPWAYLRNPVRTYAQLRKGCG
jgi:hypothetical protein